MEDSLKMKRTITEYDRDGNMTYYKTEYYPVEREYGPAEEPKSKKEEPDCESCPDWENCAAAKGAEEKTVTIRFSDDIEDCDEMTPEDFERVIRHIRIQSVLMPIGRAVLTGLISGALMWAMNRRSNT